MKVIQLESGNKLVIGSNAQENWNLLDSSNVGDLWFHLSDLPSCYVILQGNNFTKQDINLAAQHCKLNTKYRDFKTLYVDCLPIQYLRKGTKVGQVILKKKANKIKLDY